MTAGAAQTQKQHKEAFASISLEHAFAATENRRSALIGAKSAQLYGAVTPSKKRAVAAGLAKGITKPMTERNRKSLSIVSLLRLFALLCARELYGQQLGREALSSFPADTNQITFSNLAQLRSLPDYPSIRQRMFNQQLNNLQEFLRSMGVDPEKDVDEAMLGWRGEPSNVGGYFGLAAGRFLAAKIHDSFVRNKLPVREYQGVELYAYGSGEDAADLFFTFLNSSMAAFGRLGDLRAILDVRAGEHAALDSRQMFVNGEAELEGTAPQWGIATGKAAANLAAPWLTSGGKFPVDPSAFSGTLRAVLYRVEWDNGFTAKLAVLCQNSESASALAQVLTLLRTFPPSPSNASTSVASLLRDMDIQASDSRVDLKATGPIETLDQVFRSSASHPAP